MDDPYRELGRDFFFALGIGGVVFLGFLAVLVVVLLVTDRKGFWSFLKGDWMLGP